MVSDKKIAEHILKRINKKVDGQFYVYSIYGSKYKHINYRYPDTGETHIVQGLSTYNDVVNVLRVMEIMGNYDALIPRYR